jgi:hypothetical protein
VFEAKIDGRMPGDGADPGAKPFRTVEQGQSLETRDEGLLRRLLRQ